MTSLIDLSHEITAGMVTYPGLPGPVIGDHLGYAASAQHYAPGVEFQIGRIEMVGNTGTYLDTPAHRYRDGFDLADVPLAAVTDLPGVVVDAEDRRIGPGTFDGVDVRGCAVLVRTGRDRHWGTSAYGADPHPYLDAAAARHLVDEGARLVGIDAVNVDDTSPAANGERPAHSILLGADVLIVEHLCGLAALGRSPFTFSAVPVRVRGMASFPVRAFAAVADDRESGSAG